MPLGVAIESRSATRVWALQFLEVTFSVFALPSRASIVAFQRANFYCNFSVPFLPITTTLGLTVTPVRCASLWRSAKVGRGFGAASRSA